MSKLENEWQSIQTLRVTIKTSSWNIMNRRVKSQISLFLRDEGIKPQSKYANIEITEQ